MKIILLITCFLHVSADTHTLHYLYTALTPGLTDFPEFIAVGLLDGEQFMFYSSDIRTLIIKDWIKKINSDWRSETQKMQGNQHSFIITFTTAMKEFHHSEGLHTLQRMFGCECDDDDDVTTRGNDQYSYDGEDFISLNLTSGTWTAIKAQAETIKHTWESEDYNKYWKNFLERDCIDLLKYYTSYSRDTLNRKVVPEVSVFQKVFSSRSPELVCHTTGFFPKALNITWQKDGEDVHEDVELRKTLPNQDGSFQKRSILKVSSMKLWIHNYTCVVQHSSLEKELVREVPKGGGSDGGSDGESGGAPIVIITAVVAALVALGAVVAGIVVWKKKNSDFRPVPPKPYCEGDSSTTNL